jgi:hypothetical protein
VLEQRSTAASIIIWAPVADYSDLLQIRDRGPCGDEMLTFDELLMDVAPEKVFINV